MNLLKLLPTVFVCVKKYFAQALESEAFNGLKAVSRTFRPSFTQPTPRLRRGSPAIHSRNKLPGILATENKSLAFIFTYFLLHSSFIISMEDRGNDTRVISAEEYVQLKEQITKLLPLIETHNKFIETQLQQEATTKIVKNSVQTSLVLALSIPVIIILWKIMFFLLRSNELEEGIKKAYILALQELAEIRTDIKTGLNKIYKDGLKIKPRIY